MTSAARRAPALQPIARPPPDLWRDSRGDGGTTVGMIYKTPAFAHDLHMTPTIVVNGRCLHRPITGVERYATEVIARIDSHVRVVRPTRALDGGRGHLWEQMRLPALVGRGALLWSPANTGPLAVARQVVTIHDVSPLDHPEWFKGTFAAWYRVLLPLLARRVRRIITDSAFSKARILDRLRVPDTRVNEVPCGVSDRFRPASAAAIDEVRLHYQLRQPVVLTIGTLQPRKNLSRLLEAWPQVRRAMPEAELVVVGTGRSNFASTGMSDRDPSVRLLGFVDDETLCALYCAATVVIVPSLYEGFGLTALEAMACGTAVIVSSGSAVDEVVGDAALKVDGRSVDAIADAMTRLLLDPERCTELRRRGIAQARRYTWERTAAATLRILEEASHE